MDELNNWLTACISDMGWRAMDEGDLTAGENLIVLSRKPWLWPRAVEEIVAAHGYTYPQATPAPSVRRWCRYPRGGRPLLLHCAARTW